MNYILAIFLPPLSVLFTGRVFLAIVFAAIWVFIVALAPSTHILFIVVAWVIVGMARSDRKHAALLKAVKERE